MKLRFLALTLTAVVGFLLNSSTTISVATQNLEAGGTKIALINKSALGESSNSRSETISKPLEEFAKRHDFALLVDSSKIKSAILASEDWVDLTQEFIAESKRKESSETTKAVSNVSNSKIALVWTEDFYDKKSGIKGLAGQAPAIRALDGKILDALARFAKLNGITIMLDSTKLPGIISASESMDVTRAFIAFYNGGASNMSAKLTIPDTKVVIMSTDTFADERIGIAPLVQAMDRVDREFLPLKKELEAMKARLGTLSGKQRQDLSDEFERKGQKAKADYQKRMEEAIGPVYNEIGKAVDQFANDGGINLVLDSSKFPIAVAASSIDKTTLFIMEYNQRHR